MTSCRGTAATPPPRPQELALGTLMKFVQLEGAHPLEKPKWEGSYLFPRQLFKVRGRCQREPGREAVAGTSGRASRGVSGRRLGQVGHPGTERSHLPAPRRAQAVVDGLLSPEEDCSLLLSQFCTYLEHDDLRYHAMRAATDAVARVADAHTEVRGGAGGAAGGGGRSPAAGRGGRGGGGRSPGAQELRPGPRRCPWLSGTTCSRCCPP